MLALTVCRNQFNQQNCAQFLKGSITSTFYVRFFADILVPKKLKPKTQLCNFWRQNNGGKCARKMLIKSTPAVSFINNLRASFAPLELQ